MASFSSDDSSCCLCLLGHLFRPMKKKFQLKSLMHRGPDTPESTQARIRALTESSNHVCPHCGFNRFTGGIHPYAGNSGKTKSQTKWCNSFRTIEPTNLPRTFSYDCPRCMSQHLYNRDEMELADSDGKCHLCLEKENENV